MGLVLYMAKMRVRLGVVLRMQSYAKRHCLSILSIYKTKPTTPMGRRSLGYKALSM